jgi:hypothetical protein
MYLLPPLEQQQESAMSGKVQEHAREEASKA